ncbi:MAG: hypothetical protein O2816_04915 [Planctomycetota bacterium]|nr:hypothetical protein [Planctomycetota bacterium]
MKVLLVEPTYPVPGSRGVHRGRDLALGMAAAGHLVEVLAAGPPRGHEHARSREHDGAVSLHRVHRADPYPEHWMRESCVAVTRLVRGLVGELEPDVMHVSAWTGLTADLVLVAARAGVPAVIELRDHRATCLLGDRVRPESGAACAETYGPYACVRCAAQVPPKPSWVPTDMAYLSFGQRAAALGRELALARARLVPDEDHGEALVRALGAEIGPLLVAPSDEHPDRVAFHLGLYGRVVELGPPGPSEVGDEAWFEERLRAADEAAWDAAARRTDSR